MKNTVPADWITLPQMRVEISDVAQLIRPRLALKPKKQEDCKVDKKCRNSKNVGKGLPLRGGTCVP